MASQATLDIVNKEQDSAWEEEKLLWGPVKGPVWGGICELQRAWEHIPVLPVPSASPFPGSWEQHSKHDSEKVILRGLEQVGLSSCGPARSQDKMEKA